MRLYCLIVLVFVGSVTAQETRPEFSESLPYIPREFANKSGQKKDDKTTDKPKKPDTPAPAANKSVSVPVSVLDTSGRLVTGLKKENFTVFVDGTRVEVESGDISDVPLNIVLLLDTSPSADGVLDGMKSLANRLVSLLRPDDKVMVAGFAKNLRITTDFTVDRAVITKAVKKLEMGDGTSLYTSLAELVTERIKLPTENVGIVIFTDGVDTVSRKFTYQSSLMAVEQTTAAVFPIYFNTFGSRPRTSLPFPIPTPATGMNKEAYDLGRFYLTDLIKLSGGRPLLGANALAGNAASFDSIPDQLRSRFVLKFDLPASAAPGARLPLKIRINRPNLAIEAKGSLFR